MRNVFKLLGITALAAVIGFAMAACVSPDDSGGGETPDFIPVTHITGLPSYKQVDIDLTLSGTVLPTDATNKTIAWSIAADDDTSTGPSLTGNVLKTVTAGTVKVTATVINGASETADYTENFTINVAAVIPSFIHVSNITGVPSTATAGTDLALTGLVEPSDATNKTIAWSIASAGTTGATIVSNSTLKTTAAGTATVTATITNGVSETTNYTKNFTITVTAVSNPVAFNDITASQLVAGIKVGWNLGNSLDAHTGFGSNSTVTQMETGWGNPVTTKAMITALKNAGFNGIRIPVSWTKAADSNYNIRADWMNRVVEVVNYAVDNDMYIILNTHHDEDVFTFKNSNTAAGKAAFQKIWEQIANTFKDYNEKLIFEGLNEPRTIGSAAEWGGGTDEERANINAYYQTFVNTVRASGGNNDKRILQINTYAASAEQSALDGLTLPTDTVQNKLIVSVHIYAPYNFAMNESGTDLWSASNPADVSGITAPIDRAYNKFARNGTPVIIGEFGARNKNNNTSARTAWAEYYVSYAKGRGIPCFIWDNGVVSDPESESFEILNRSDNTFTFPTIKDALIRGANNPITPDDSDPTPNPIGGNMGNFSFGKQANNIDPNYTQAVWTLTGTASTTAKQSGAKLVLVLNAAPSASMQLVWQGPANELWWNEKAILNDNGSPINGTGVTWNAGTKTLTINLATALADYSTFTAQPLLNIIIAYYSGGSVNDLGIISANLVE